MTARVGRSPSAASGDRLDGRRVGERARVATAQVGEPSHADDRHDRAGDGERRGRPVSADGADAVDEESGDGGARGGADELEIVRRASERSGLGDMIRIVTPKDAEERARVVAGAEVFVYPALSEATALPVLEALSLGVPVICSRAGALPEVVASAGIVVAPRDASRLAAAICPCHSGCERAAEEPQGENP